MVRNVAPLKRMSTLALRPKALTRLNQLQLKHFIKVVKTIMMKFQYDLQKPVRNFQQTTRYSCLCLIKLEHFTIFMAISITSFRCYHSLTYGWFFMLLFQLVTNTYSTCQDISFLHHFLDIILETFPARGASPSHLGTSFTLNSKNSNSRITQCARTVFFRFSMDATSLRPRWADSADMRILPILSLRRIISRLFLIAREICAEKDSRPSIARLQVHEWCFVTQ